MSLISFGPVRALPQAQDMLDAEQMRALAISLLYTAQARGPVSYSQWYSEMDLHFRTPAQQQRAQQILNELIETQVVRHTNGAVHLH